MKMPTCLLLCSIFLLTKTSVWSIPAGFNVQGRLTDANGVNRDGTFSMKFSIYSGPNTGADLKWYRTIQTVPVKNGVFQVVLSGLGENSIPLETAVKDLTDAYVEIQVGSDPPLSPRQQLLRSPFSSSDKVSGANDVLISAGSGRIAMQTNNSEHVTVTQDGKVGIGTVSPAEKLSVAGNLAVSGAISADNFIGSVMFFVTPVCPVGWLPADGRAVAESEHQKLADAMGKHGTGTFTLPDLRGMFIRGADDRTDASKVDPDAPRAVGTFQGDAFKSHNHEIPTYTNKPWNASRVSRHDTNNRIGTAYTENTGDIETRPKNIALMPCVKR